MAAENHAVRVTFQFGDTLGCAIKVTCDRDADHSINV